MLCFEEQVNNLGISHYSCRCCEYHKLGDTPAHPTVSPSPTLNPLLHVPPFAEQPPRTFHKTLN